MLARIHNVLGPVPVLFVHLRAVVLHVKAEIADWPAGACCRVVLTGLLVLDVLCCRLWSKVVAGAPRENVPFDKTALPSFSGKPVV